jgi:hypothetical protein
LSVKRKADPSVGTDQDQTGRKAPDAKKGRKQRAGDIGRALRSIYDDTLRESVPDDFTDLLGKLT